MHTLQQPAANLGIQLLNRIVRGLIAFDLGYPSKFLQSVIVYIQSLQPRQPLELPPYLDYPIVGDVQVLKVGIHTVDVDPN